MEVSWQSSRFHVDVANFQLPAIKNYRGINKNAAQLITLFVLANHYLVRKKFLYPQPRRALKSGMRVNNSLLKTIKHEI